MGDAGSEMTEPLELYDEDVFVANLEDPAKKYAAITKKMPPSTLETTPEGTDPYAEFCGSRLMYFAMGWCLICIIVIAVVVRAVCPNCDDTDPTMAPSIPEPIDPTMAPSVIDLIPETTVPTGAETELPEVPVTDPPVVETEAPTATPVVATEAPTTSPVATDAPTVGVVATGAPTAAATEVVATGAPTAAATEVVATGAPTAGATGVVGTEAPTTSGPVDLRAVLPEYTQAALEDPTSPQSQAFLFVNYDPFVATRTEEELIQRFALATIYFGLGSSSWTAGAVNPAGDECEWFADTGSLCDADDRMQSLLLQENGVIDGPIPAEVGLLTALTELDMSRNTITGTIPTFLGQLTVLETLRLADNQLTGTIPTELSSIESLLTLELTGLDLVTGVVPDELCEAATFDCRPEDLCGCDCACAAA